MEREIFQKMMTKLEKKFPHGSRRGRRNSVLPTVSLVDWATAAKVRRTQLLGLLRNGTKRMSISVAQRLGDAFKWGRYTEVEEFINDVAERHKRKLVKGGMGYVVNGSSSLPPATATISLEDNP